MKILITGAAGFFGSHLCEHLLKATDWEIILLDKLAYASNGMSRLRDIKVFDQNKNRVSMFAIDISYPISSGVEKEIGGVDYIVHIAAESDVNRSIADPRPFVQSNVVGTMEMLQLARKMMPRLKAYLQFSTDECFGPCYDGAPSFKEWSRYLPTNPYASTKAAADMLCFGWANTYGVPLIVTNCMNMYGERQHPEKFIPLVIRKILRSEMIYVHSDPTRTKAGSRAYIHCRNAASAIHFILENSKAGTGMKLKEKFNIVGEQEIDNLALATMIHKTMEEAMNKKLDFKVELVDFHSSRPGHDLRYALDGRKLAELGWTPPKDFQTSLEKTVRWSISPENLHWLLLEDS